MKQKDSLEEARTCTMWGRESGLDVYGQDRLEEASHTGFCLNLAMRDWHGHDGGREACGSWGWWFSVHLLL